jgi:hypothetical protein
MLLVPGDPTTKFIIQKSRFPARIAKIFFDRVSRWCPTRFHYLGWDALSATVMDIEAGVSSLSTRWDWDVFKHFSDLDPVFIKLRLAECLRVRDFLKI